MNNVRLRFEESLDYLENLYHLPHLPSSTVGLRRAEFLLDRLDNPHRAFRSVHVAGSSGKGSTVTMIGSVLEEAGHKTGYFRSPHLSSYTERVSVDGRDIEQDDWARHLDRIVPVAEAMRTDSYPGYRLGRPTLFEILFALAALHFAETGVAWAAMETGLGGRLDATNLLSSDVAVITNISLEHTQILGTSVAAIAAEKAAIIKHGAHAVTAAEDPDALRVIEAQARDVGAPLLRVGRDVKVETDPVSAIISLTGPGASLQIKRPGDAAYQARNAASAFGSALALIERGTTIDDDALRRGLERAHVPGRFERIPGSPEVILDGAHNPAAMVALADSLCQSDLQADVLLFAAMEDKDIEAMASFIAGFTREVVVTTVPGTDRGSSPARAISAFRSLGSTVHVVEQPDDALICATQRAGTGTLLVAGSLYLVGFVRSSIRGTHR